MALVPLPTLKQHLRMDLGETAEDGLVTLYSSAAEESAMEYLNRRVYADADEMAAAVLAGTAGADPMLVNDAIRAAVLLILGHLYTNREDVGTVALAALPRGSRDLLTPYRVGWGV